MRCFRRRWIGRGGMAHHARNGVSSKRSVHDIARRSSTLRINSRIQLAFVELLEQVNQSHIKFYITCEIFKQCSYVILI